MKRLVKRWLSRRLCRETAGNSQAMSRLWDLVYPPHCPLCGSDGGPGLCPVCRDEIGDGAGRRCGRCGQPTGPRLHSNVLSKCVHCRGRQWAFQGVERLGLYEGALREACIGGKSDGAEPLAAALGKWFWECRGEALEHLDVDLVVPVPQHWTKRIAVAHNQAETLAGVLGRCLRVPVAGIYSAKHAGLPTSRVCRLPGAEPISVIRFAFGDAAGSMEFTCCWLTMS